MANLQKFEDVVFAARTQAGVFFCEATHSAQYNPTSTIVNGIALALILANRVRIKAERLEIPGGIDGFLEAARLHMLEFDIMARSYDDHNKLFKVSSDQLSLQKDIPATAKRYDGKYPQPVFDWVIGYITVADWLVSSFKSDFGFPTTEKALLLQGLFLRKCDAFYEAFVLMAGGEPFKGNEVDKPAQSQRGAVISKEICQQLVDICKKADVLVGALALIFGWPGHHDAIFRADAFVMAAVMAAHFRYIFEGNAKERMDDDPFVGDCLKEKCRKFDTYAPGMMEILQGHTITDGLRSIIRNAISSLKYDKSENAKSVVDQYGLLAVWAAKTVFPPSSLIRGEQDQVEIVAQFAKNFDECYQKWKKILVERNVLEK